MEAQGIKNQPNRLLATGSEELRDRLPRGAVARLAEKYGLSWTWIYNVVSGFDQGDPMIIRDAEQLAEIEDESRKRIKAIV